MVSGNFSKKGAINKSGKIWKKKQGARFIEWICERNKIDEMIAKFNDFKV